MSGKPITQQQVNLYMSYRKNDLKTTSKIAQLFNPENHTMFEW